MTKKIIECVARQYFTYRAESFLGKGYRSYGDKHRVLPFDFDGLCQDFQSAVSIEEMEFIVDLDDLDIASFHEPTRFLDTENVVTNNKNYLSKGAAQCR